MEVGEGGRCLASSSKAGTWGVLGSQSLVKAVEGGRAQTLMGEAARTEEGESESLASLAFYSHLSLSCQGYGYPPSYSLRSVFVREPYFLFAFDTLTPAPLYFACAQQFSPSP